MAPYLHISNLHNQQASAKLCSYINSLFHPESVLDVGCGTGNFLASFKSLGAKRVLGLDGDWVDRDQRSQFLSDDEFKCVDLKRPQALSETFSLTLCLEVAEHLPSEAANDLIDLLCSSTDIVVFSAAIPWQPGQNHINLKWPEEWATLFRKKGMLVSDQIRYKLWDDDGIPWWYRQNIFIAYRDSAIPKVEFPPTEKLLPLVHPKLLSIHATHVEYITKGNSTLKSYCAMLAKNVLRSFGKRF
jgi:SAM-dependent methyltransferase